MVHDPVADVKTVHAEHAVVTWVCRGQSRFAWQGMHHGAGHHLEELLQFALGLRQHDTVSSNDHRAFSLTQEGNDVIERRVHGCLGRCRRRGQLGRVCRRESARMDAGLLGVFRQIDQHRPWPPLCGNAKRFTDYRRHILRAV